MPIKIFDMLKSTVQEEKKVVKLMIEIYCHAHHAMAKGELCDNCLALYAYAEERLNRCPFGDNKGACSRCAIHCYKPTMRNNIIEVMRYSGRRTILYSPKAAIKHLWQLATTKK